MQSVSVVNVGLAAGQVLRALPLSTLIWGPPSKRSHRALTRLFPTILLVAGVAASGGGGGDDGDDGAVTASLAGMKLASMDSSASRAAPLEDLVLGYVLCQRPLLLLWAHPSLFLARAGR